MTYKAPADLESEFQLEWFGGDRAALDMAKTLARLSNIVDDLVDKDIDVATSEICDAFLTCLVKLPTNPFYARHQHELTPMWLSVFSAYETATKYEQDKDGRGLEMAHVLRYSPGMMIAHAIIRCVGIEKSREYTPLMWKVVINERYSDYMREHADEPVNETK